MRDPEKHKKPFSLQESEKERYDPNKMPLRFSFRFLVNHSDYDFESLGKEQKVALMNTIYKLSKYNWSELRLNDRHGKGYEKIAKSSLKFRLPKDVPADCTIVAFRFYEMDPMIGYISAWGTFYIVAIDRKYRAYSH